MIYIIETTNHFKVGYTSNCFEAKRSKAYDTHNPDWKLIKTTDGDKFMETYVNRKLRGHKHRGEWMHKFEGWLNKVEDIINSYDAFNGQDAARLYFRSGLTRIEKDLFGLITMKALKERHTRGALPSEIKLKISELAERLNKPSTAVRKGLDTLIGLGIITELGLKDKYSLNMAIIPRI